MRALQRQNLLGNAFGIPEATPTMLLWGVPIPKGSAAGDELRARLVRVLRDRLHERRDWYTEPDVILDFGSSIIFIEAKLTSENEREKPDYSGWKTYLNTIAFRNEGLAISSELYQLARNWRIALELANGHAFKVVNLAPSFPKGERRPLAMLRASIEANAQRTLTLRTWKANMQAAPSLRMAPAICERPRSLVGVSQQLGVRNFTGNFTALSAEWAPNVAVTRGTQIASLGGVADRLSIRVIERCESGRPIHASSQSCRLPKAISALRCLQTDLCVSALSFG